jgi:hypothetical protein
MRITFLRGGRGGHPVPGRRGTGRTIGGELADQPPDEGRGRPDGAGDRLAEAGQPGVGVLDVQPDSCRLDSDDDQAPWPAAERVGEPQDPERVQAVAVDHGGRGQQPARIGRVGVVGRLDHGDRPGRVAARSRVDEDRGVDAAREGVGEIESADPEVLDASCVRHAFLEEPLDDVAAERVIAEEDVADPRDEDAAHDARPRGDASASSSSGA